VFCLLVVLVKLSLLAKWLARKTPLRKPNRDEGIVSRKPRPKSACDFLGLLCCFIVLLCICVVSCPYVRYLHCALASCGAVYCNRSCLWICVFATGGQAGARCPNLTTASACAVFASLWALFSFPTVMGRYSLFVLKLPLNPKRANKQKKTLIGCLSEMSVWEAGTVHGQL